MSFLMSFATKFQKMAAEIRNFSAKCLEFALAFDPSLKFANICETLKDINKFQRKLISNVQEMFETVTSTN